MSIMSWKDIVMQIGYRVMMRLNWLVDMYFYFGVLEFCGNLPWKHWLVDMYFYFGVLQLFEIYQAYMYIRIQYALSVYCLEEASTKAVALKFIEWYIAMD